MPRGRKPQEVVEYRAAHVRLGKAREHTCVDCEGPASEWSLNHDADALVSNDKYTMGKEYSLNPEDYSPRCRSCHRKYDGIIPVWVTRRNAA